MALEEQLSADLKSAMKARETDKLTTLRAVKAAIDNHKIQEKSEKISDDEILGIIQKQAKQRKESIESFANAGRTELVQKEELELAILEAYLPAQLSDDELSAIIKKAIAASGANSKADMSKVMPLVMPQVKGKADGKRVNQIVMSLLN